MADDAGSRLAAARKLQGHALQEHTDEDDDVTSKQHSPVNMQHEPAAGAGTDATVHALELARLRLSQDQPNGNSDGSRDISDEAAGQHDEMSGIPLPSSNGKRSVRSFSDPLNSRRSEVAAQAQQQQNQQQQQQQQAAAGSSGLAVPLQVHFRHGLSQQLAEGADVGAALQRLLQLRTGQVHLFEKKLLVMGAPRPQGASTSSIACQTVTSATVSIETVPAQCRWRLCRRPHSCAAAWAWTCQPFRQLCRHMTPAAMALGRHPARTVLHPSGARPQHRRPLLLSVQHPCLAKHQSQWQATRSQPQSQQLVMQ